MANLWAWQYLVVPAYTGPSKRARPVGVEADPLRGENPHAVVLVKTARGWKAWCACTPGRVSRVHPAPSAAVHETVQAHHSGEGATGMLPLTLTTGSEYGVEVWRYHCACDRHPKRSFELRAEAEEAAILHWTSKHHNPVTKTTSSRSPETQGRNSRQSSYFRAWVRSVEGRWVLKHKTRGALEVRLTVSDAVMARLVDTHAEFKIVATLPDGTPVVEPYFATRRGLVQDVQAKMAKRKPLRDTPTARPNRT